jgi:predicted lipoprotein with Yx(FWY)xxD motif
MIKALICAVACALPLAAFAEQPKAVQGMLVDGSGMTLYTSDADAKVANGKSACTGLCAAAWPAATADQSDKPGGDWSIVDTADGKHQWAYKGQRLYRFAKDTQPGDMKGDGIKGVWHMAKP